MQYQFKSIAQYIASVFVIALTLTSCQKEFGSKQNLPTDNTSLTTTATSPTIAVAASSSSGTATTGGSSSDSVYVMHTCEKGHRRDSIAFTALPATVQAYLGANYTGYSFIKAFAVKDTTGTIKGYVAIVRFNDKPVALLFKADGTFSKVLEQREKNDLEGEGWHNGGRFEFRDGKCKDTLALNDLPQSVKAYMTTSYPSDTLVKAFKTREGAYIVFSKNNGAFVTVFNANGGFEKRVALPAAECELENIAQGSLPGAIQSYLSATYPNYVFNKADKLTVNGTIKGYLVIINANNTRYAVAFDADGRFLAAKVIF
jgi:hypothetical protein